MSQYFTPEAVVRGGPEILLGVAEGLGDGVAAAARLELERAPGSAAEFAGFLVCAASKTLAVSRVITKTDCRIRAPLGFRAKNLACKAES
jgi:hypothetical protein